MSLALTSWSSPTSATRLRISAAKLVVRPAPSFSSHSHSPFAASKLADMYTAMSGPASVLCGLLCPDTSVYYVAGWPFYKSLIKQLRSGAVLIFADVMKHSRRHLDEILFVMDQCLHDNLGARSSQEEATIASPAPGPMSHVCHSGCAGRLAKADRAGGGRKLLSKLSSCSPVEIQESAVLKNWWVSSGESLKSEVLVVVKL